jgi:hypothetical protein
MKITIESTAKMVEINGVPARVWQGRTESGIEVHCFVTRIAVPREQDVSEFEEHAPPRPELADYPPRLVL